MWQCKHCNNLFDFETVSQRANHSRWCDKNPKVENYRSNKNLATAVSASFDRKYGHKKTYQVTCFKCQKLFDVVERENVYPSKDKYYCSRQCANSRVITKEHRIKTSETITGRKYVEPREITTACKQCFKPFTLITQKSPWNTSNEGIKSFCSRSCATKYGNRERVELARTNRSALTNYRADCAFKFSLNDYPEEFDFTLVETHGWYKAKNRGDNLGGVSRDHMVSVRWGFDNQIPAEHIAHPANCRLITQNENSSKNKQNFITYEELLNRICEWDKKYHSTTIRKHNGSSKWQE